MVTRLLRRSDLNPAVRIPKIEPESLVFNDRAATSHDCAPSSRLAPGTASEDPLRSRRAVRGKPLRFRADARCRGTGRSRETDAVPVLSVQGRALSGGLQVGAGPARFGSRDDPEGSGSAGPLAGTAA